MDLLYGVKAADSKIFVNPSKKDVVNGTAVSIILFLAAFSDILRIPGTAITFFRLCIPLAVFITLFYTKWSKILLKASLVFLMTDAFFTVCFFATNRITFDGVKLIESLQYVFFYLCIILVFVLVGILRDITGRAFCAYMIHFIEALAGIFVLLIVLNVLVPNVLPLDNRNNYACYLVAANAFLLGEFVEKKSPKSIVFMLLILLALLMNDSKAAILGALMECAVMFGVSNKNERKSFLVHRFVIPALAIVAVLVVSILDLQLNNYSLRYIIYDPLKRVLMHAPYPTYTSSFSFRTNTTIYALDLIWENKGMGIGAGNTGLLLKQAFPNINPTYLAARDATRLSLHNAWLEFMIDFGIPGIVVTIIPLLRSLKVYLFDVLPASMEKVRTCFVISFFVWVIGSSGIYTQYYLFTVMAFLLFERGKWVKAA